MDALVLATLTLVAAVNGRRAWRDAGSAPHRTYRWLMRVLVVTMPVYLVAGWLGLFSSGTTHGFWEGVALVAGAPMGLAALGVLLVIASAPLRRR